MSSAVSHITPMHIDLTCLGAFAVAVDGRPVAHFPTDKVRALLAYLALELGPHRREALAGLLWPDIGQPYALSNLRHSLHRLRQTLEAATPGVSDALFTTTRQTIELNREALNVDAVRFENLIAGCEQHPHASLADCTECLTHMAQAVELYRGELLAGFGLEDAPAFEEWLLVRREALHHHMALSLHALVEAHERRGDFAKALTYANRQLALDPYREDAHRQVMRLLARLGQTHHALAHYDACRRLLREELDVEPDAETVALYKRIQIGHFRLPTESPRGIADSRLTHDAQVNDAIENRKSKIENWMGVPDPGPFFGREAEVAQLERWLVHDRCRVVAVLGMGGVGKTTLAASVAHAAANQFERVMWQSLLNAPAVSEVLKTWLQTLAEQSLTDFPASVDAQLALLLDGLRRERCLIVLDNLESILQPDQPGRTRPGYEGYDQFIQRITDHAHNSCLLLTSRERPQGMARRASDAPFVRTLMLEGLDTSAGRAMLAARGLSGSEGDIATLIRRYSGNPLALKLVAQTIRELFAGDVTAFLAIETPIFADIRAVLDQQFARLLPLEREIMTWLAIEREPISFQVLRDDLVHPPPMSTLLDALRALQRRSLVSQSGHGLMLQNVVTEYVTEGLVEQVCREIEDDSVTRWHGDKANEASVTLAPSHLVTLSFLNRYALLKATAKEAVRASQTRLILQPVAERLMHALGEERLVVRLKEMVTAWQPPGQRLPGYAAGNVLNLLLHLDVDVRGYDFSRLNVWQADLRGRALSEVNFAHADLAGSAFTDTFRSVECVAFGPPSSGAGQWVAAGSGDGTVRLWHVSDRKPSGMCVGHTSFVWSVAFSPNGEWLASASEDGTVGVWDIRAITTSATVHRQRDHTLQGHTRWLKCVAFSPDGALLASSGGDGTVRLWDTRSWETVSILLGHSAGVWSVAFSPDGRTLASASEDSTLRLWDVSTGQHLHMLHGHAGRVTCVAFSPDGTLLASGAHDGTIRIWDARAATDGRLDDPIDPIHTYTISTGWVNTLAFSPDGALLVAGCGDRTTRIWEVGSLVEAGRLIHTLYGHTNPVVGVAFRYDGGLVATASEDRTLRLWDVRRNWEVVDILHGYRCAIRSVVFCLGGTAIASGGLDGIVRIWDLRSPLQQTGRLLHVLYGHTHMIGSVATDRDGARLASGSLDHTIRLWDARSGRTIRELRGHIGYVRSVRFSPDGARLASGSDDGAVCLWDADSGQAIYTLRLHHDAVMAVAWSPDGKWLASAGRDRVIHISEVSTGRTRGSLQGHARWVKSLDFSPDSALLASSSDEDVVLVWNVDDGKMIKTLHGHTNVIESVAFSPRMLDSRLLLASASYDNTVRVWDVYTGEVIHDLKGHSNWVSSVAFSPDGALLVSAGFDETTRVWDVATGECLQTLRAPGPYAGMNITGVIGISPAQKAALRELGAVDE